MVVLKNCEPQLYYILVELFNIFLKEFCQIGGRSNLGSLYFRAFGIDLQVKATALSVFFLWFVKPLKNV